MPDGWMPDARHWMVFQNYFNNAGKHEKFVFETEIIFLLTILVEGQW